MINKLAFLDKLRIFFLSSAAFCYFFQFPISKLASFITIFLLLYIVLSVNKIKILNDIGFILVLVIYFIYLSLEILISAKNNTDIGRMFRFLEILCMIPICMLIQDKYIEIEFKIICCFAIIKTLILIGIGIYLIITGSHILIRNWVKSNGGGDIYLLGRIPKVQVQGNGIIPIIFIIKCLKDKSLSIITVLLLFGILFAGNFAFILGIFIFFFYLVLVYLHKDKYYYKPVFILLLFLVIFPLLYSYLSEKIEQKKEESNAIRIEQITVLFDTNLFFGNGLGYYIKAKTPHRIYNGDMYFELQSLYIFNQIGIIGLLLFYLITAFYVYRFRNLNLLIYFIYLFYTFWNPYCFDTTQMFTLLILCNLSFSENKG